MLTGFKLLTEVVHMHHSAIIPHHKWVHTKATSSDKQATNDKQQAEQLEQVQRSLLSLCLLARLLLSPTRALFHSLAQGSTTVLVIDRVTQDDTRRQQKQHIADQTQHPLSFASTHSYDCVGDCCSLC